MAVDLKTSDQQIASPAAAGRVEHDDGDEHAGAAHTSALVAVAVCGAAGGLAPARRARR